MLFAAPFIGRFHCPYHAVTLGKPLLNQTEQRSSLMGRRQRTTQKAEVSAFAKALDRILQATDVQKQQWARWLDVSNGAISQWTGDICMPSPDNLYRLLAILRDFKGLDQSALNKFARILDARAWEVVPKSKSGKVQPSIGYYMLRSLRESFMSALATIPTRAQEELLTEGLALIKELEESDESFDLFASSQDRSISLQMNNTASPEPEHIATMLHDVESWNHYRVQNPDWIPNIKGVDLVKVDLTEEEGRKPQGFNPGGKPLLLFDS